MTNLLCTFNDRGTIRFREHHVRLFAATEVDGLVDEIRRTATDQPAMVASEP